MEYQSLSPNIGVKDVNETVNFYKEVLGFNLAMSNPELGDLEWAMLMSGNAVIMFQKLESLIREYPQLNNRADNCVITFYVKMKNMMQLYDKLKSTNHIAKDLHKTFYGADEFAIIDNNGFILTVTEDK